ncbi:hypothetical protein [Streptomyces endophyticus]|uniref:Extensin n=1 Tax=Streptomyces endophyticus TaxID=714166 RepID=A0ABU6F3P8_9ACTN|nr:hypothetical protein [Streptomyces endophyticus]MEB8338624.1 hypothetical protein [Streptomyces endophyticus]
MADEHDKWLNRDAADRLLRGEAPAEAPDDARRADLLTAALHALAEVPTGPQGELPGEDAALKAFRETRAVTAVNGAVSGAVNGSARAGRVRRSARSAPKTSGRRLSWGRPARLGAVAAFAACMVGGVAVAAGTGVLPSPFRGSDDPAPASSVSAAASPDRPLASASAGVTEDGHAVPGPTEPSGTSGSGSTSRSPSHDNGKGTPGDGRTSKGKGPKADASGNEGARAGAQARKLVDTCRKYRSGQSGAADVQRLEASAKALGQDRRSLDRFCDRVLARSGAPATSADRTASHHTDDKSASGSQTASDNGNGSDGKGAGESGSGNEDEADEDGDPGAAASPSPSPSATSSPSPAASASPTP